MVEYMGRPMIDWELSALRAGGAGGDIVIIRGYCAEALTPADACDVRYVLNPQFDSTNMVATLFCAAHNGRVVHNVGVREEGSWAPNGAVQLVLGTKKSRHHISAVELRIKHVAHITGVSRRQCLGAVTANDHDVAAGTAGAERGQLPIDHWASHIFDHGLGAVIGQRAQP